MPTGAASLRVNTVNRGPICYMQLAGVVDESFDPHALVNQVTGTKLVLNLKGVARLTSFGVREWAAAMRQLSGKIERVYWVECSPAVVSQLNMVANFAGNAQVLSVQAPFFCESCGTDCEVRCDVSDGADSLPTDVHCPKCGKTMAFDDDPESYFGFPKENRVGERAIDAAMISILRSLGVAVSGTDDLEPRQESDPTMIPAQPQHAHGHADSPANTSNDGQNSLSTSATIDRVRSLSTTGATGSQHAAHRSLTNTIIEAMDRHWAVVVGVAVVVVVVALYLLLTTPPAME